MKVSRVDMRALISICALLGALLGCEYDGPQEIWDPNQSLGEEPVIEQIVPPDRAVAGANDITLIGKNFSSDVARVRVYFSGEQAPIKSASPTEIKLYRPPVARDSLSIELVILDAYAINSFSPYGIDEVKFLVDALEGAGNSNISVIAVDRDENLYVLNQVRTIRRVTPNGVVTDYASLPTSGAAYNPRNYTEMRVGPNGSLYLAKSGTNVRSLDRIPPGGGAVESFGTIPQNVQFFDFAENGNIFAGGPSGLFVIDPAGAASAVGDYDGFQIRAVRVFAPYVYVAATGTGVSGIWRSRIESPSTLAAKEQFFDWANGTLAGAPISSMAIDLDGNVFVGTNDTSFVNPLLFIKSDGSASEIFYPGIIERSVERLVWGPGNSLYISRRFAGILNRRVLRIDMGKKGAPDYGRI